MKKIFIVVNVDWFFLSHRLPIALAAQENGYEVTIVAGNTGKGDEITKHGFNYIDLPLSRGKSSLIKEIKTILFLFKLYLTNQPAILHQVGLKVIIFGTIAHTISFSKSCLINALSGAGTMFTTQNSNQNKFGWLLAIFKFFSKTKTHYIFQNSDDLALFKKLTNKVVNYTIIKGSGVDIDVYKYEQAPLNALKTFLFIGRLLKEKGVIELVSAAKLLKNDYFGKIKFTFLGQIDTQNPTGISKGFIEQNSIENYIEWVGHVDDVLPFLKKSYVVVLPSYREGLPKALIEACSVGRAIVTTNTVGCKEVVEDGVNGFLVPIKSIEMLAQRIEQLILDESTVLKFGEQSRRKAEIEFDLSIVVESTLKVYDLVNNSHR